MIPLLTSLLAGCAPDVTEVAVHDQGIWLDGRRILDVAEVDRSPLDAHLPELLDALATTPLRPSRIVLQPGDPWYRARTLYHALAESGRKQIWFESADGHRFGPTRPPGSRYGRRCDPGLAATGAAPVVRLDLFHGPDGDWVEASARFEPLIEGSPTDVAPECWVGPACDAVWPEGALRTACTADDSAPGDRATLGGKSGCVAPIARPGADAGWTAELAESLAGWHLPAGSELVLSPEPAVPYQRFLEVLGAIDTAGLPFPVLPEAMVQGNDGPPLCEASIRDGAGLAEATARWYGWNSRHP